MKQQLVIDTRMWRFSLASPTQLRLQSNTVEVHFSSAIADGAPQRYTELTKKVIHVPSSVEVRWQIWTSPVSRSLALAAEYSTARFALVSDARIPGEHHTHSMERRLQW